MTSTVSYLSHAQDDSSPYWFQDNFLALFALNYRLREFPASAIALNRGANEKQLMLFSYKSVLTADTWIYAIRTMFNIKS